MENVYKFWNGIAKHNPHWGVLTCPEYDARNIRNTVNTFFETGRETKDFVLQLLRDYNVFPSTTTLSSLNAVEIGSGVGRIATHIAPLVKHLYCVDISEKYMELCAKQLRGANCSNFSMVHYNDFMRSPLPPIDLVYTFITLQHIPPNDIVNYVKRICDVLAPGGAALLHIPYHIPNYQYRDISHDLQMNMVPKETILKAIRDHRCELIAIKDDIDFCGGGVANCMYIFRAPVSR